MAGHSKWNNIKRKKGAADAKRGKIFTKIGREIQVAVREGGPDPEANNRLRDAISNAKANNMPNDTITRSIKKASGDQSGDDWENVQYEGYGPSGVAVIVRTLTDNRNRTAAEVRHAFDKHGGNLGTTGSVAFMFEEKGEIYIEADDIDEEELMLLALDNGADDVENLGQAYVITTTPGNYRQVRDSLEASGYEIADASVGPVANTSVKLNEEDAIKMQKLIDQLEDSDDVQDVYHNWEEDEEQEE